MAVLERQNAEQVARAARLPAGLCMLGDGTDQSEGALPETEWPCQRPDFGPNQIRSEDEIRYGMRLTECSLLPELPTGTLTVKSKTSYYWMGGLYVDVAYDRTEGIINLMDFNVISTHEGRWNPYHWLEFSNGCGR